MKSALGMNMHVRTHTCIITILDRMESSFEIHVTTVSAVWRLNTTVRRECIASSKL